MTDNSLPIKNIFSSETAQAYIESHTKEPHPYLKTIRADCKNHKWQFMLTTKEQAAFLHILAKILNSKKILEIGSFYGHSTLALASGLTGGGKVIAIEHNPKFAKKTLEHVNAAGCGSLVDVLVGEARDMLVKVESEHPAQSFDLCFLDADKRHYALYWESALHLVRPGGVIVVDNAFARGAVFADDIEQAGHVEAVRQFNDLVFKDCRVFSFIASMADGMLVAMKLPSNRG
jgi:caffeoyl-CoA O-methyltransferase